MNFLSYISLALGWIYVFLWSYSFYPMLYEIIKLKSGVGVKIDYQALNITGYTALSIYSTAGYFNHNLGLGVVDLEDLIFAYHGWVLSIMIFFSILYFPRENNQFNKITVIILVVIWVFTVIYTLLTLIFDIIPTNQKTNAYQIMGYDKLIITFIKYIPQVVYNYQRKSTFGWNIYVTLTDLGGGLLSLLQTIIDHINPDETNPDFNLVKFILGLITLAFDFTLAFQHYILYSQKKKVDILYNENQEEEVDQD